MGTRNDESALQADLGRVASKISHDLNNLLSSITVDIELAKMQLGPQTESYSYLLNANNTIIKASNIIRILHGAANGKMVQRRQIEAEKLLKNLWNSYIQPDYPDCSIELSLHNQLSSIEAEPEQIEKVFFNLISNGLESMGKSGCIQICVEDVSIDEVQKYPLVTGDFVRFSVIDRGKGIDSSSLKQIFSTNTSETGQSKAITLPVTYSIVKNHFGHIEVDSQPGKGSRFDVYLPASSHPMFVSK